MLYRLHRRSPKLTVGTDKGDDTGMFVDSFLKLKIPPRVFQKLGH